MRKILKINDSGEKPELFHSLKSFFDKYPEYLPQKRSFQKYLSDVRKKPLFVNFQIYRLEVE